MVSLRTINLHYIRINLDKRVLKWNRILKIFTQSRSLHCITGSLYRGYTVQENNNNNIKKSCLYFLLKVDFLYAKSKSCATFGIYRISRISKTILKQYVLFNMYRIDLTTRWKFSRSL